MSEIWNLWGRWDFGQRDKAFPTREAAVAWARGQIRHHTFHSWEHLEKAGIVGVRRRVVVFKKDHANA